MGGRGRTTVEPQAGRLRFQTLVRPLPQCRPRPWASVSLQWLCLPVTAVPHEGPGNSETPWVLRVRHRRSSAGRRPTPLRCAFPQAARAGVPAGAPPAWTGPCRAAELRPSGHRSPRRQPPTVPPAHVHGWAKGTEACEGFCACWLTSRTVTAGSEAPAPCHALCTECG